MPLVGGAVQHITERAQLGGGAANVGKQVGLVKLVQAWRHPAQIGTLRVIRERVSIVPGVHLNGDAPLPEVVGALRPDGFVFGLAQHGQKHRRENGNDCDNHQKLDQGETAAAARLAANHNDALMPCHRVQSHIEPSACVPQSIKMDRCFHLCIPRCHARFTSFEVGGR